MVEFFDDYRLFERNKSAVPSERIASEFDQDVKESATVVFYNMLEGGIDLDVKKGYRSICDALVSYIVKNRSSVRATLTPTAYQSLRLAFRLKNSRPSPKYVSYWLSCALVIHGRFPGFRMVRNKEFIWLKHIGGRLSGVSKESWSRMDVLLVRKNGDALASLTDAVRAILPTVRLDRLDKKKLAKVAADQETLNRLNDLFAAPSNEHEGKKDFVAISLKERRAQQGRANEFVDALVRSVKSEEGSTILSIASNTIKSMSDDLPSLRREIASLRRKVEAIGGKRLDLLVRQGVVDNVKVAQVKVMAYRLLLWLCGSLQKGDFQQTVQNSRFADRGVDNAFVGMVAWVMNLIFSPPYYKAQGTGGLFTNRYGDDTAVIHPFWSGMTLRLAQRHPIQVVDSPTFGGLVLTYTVVLETDTDLYEGDVEIAIRTSGYDNVDILFRKLMLGTDF